MPKEVGAVVALAGAAGVRQGRQDRHMAALTTVGTTTRESLSSPVRTDLTFKATELNAHMDAQ